MSNFYQHIANTWDYKASLDGLTRIGAAGSKSLIWGYPVIDNKRTKFLYKSSKNYQFQISINLMIGGDSTAFVFYGPFSTFFPFPDTSGRPNVTIYESSTQTIEQTYYCYGRPQFDYESTTGGQFDATLAFSASSLTNFKTVEFDYFINGHKYKSSSTSDTTCDGWIYYPDTDSFFYSFNNLGGVGALAGTTHSAENFIARYIDFDNFNLVLNVTYNGGSSGNGLDIYLTETDPTSFPYDSLVKQKIYHMPYTTNGIQSYNLSGLTGSQYFLINASASSGFEFTISDIKVQGGYHPINNQTVSILNPLQIDNQDGSLGFSYSTIDSSGNAQYLNSKFGNGKFSKGIWKNGIWNSGWRNDNYSADLDDIVIAIKKEYVDRNGQVFLKDIAAKHGIDKATVSTILSFKYYKEIGLKFNSKIVSIKEKKKSKKEVLRREKLEKNICIEKLKLDTQRKKQIETKDKIKSSISKINLLRELR